MKIIMLENDDDKGALEFIDFVESSPVIDLLIQEIGKYGSKDNYFAARLVRKYASAEGFDLCLKESMDGFIVGTGKNINKAIKSLVKECSGRTIKFYNKDFLAELDIEFPLLKHTLDIQPPAL